mmetsp:Transcript_19363/g.41195  ORF Transcript_19363/g.41195 Transcript_19363/m.41195 type:complete len:223 (-) Transcript_19363:65-733(-)
MDLRGDDLPKRGEVRVEVIVGPIDRHMEHEDVRSHGSNAAHHRPRRRTGTTRCDGQWACPSGHRACCAGRRCCGPTAELGGLLPPRLLGDAVEVVGLPLRRCKLLPRGHGLCRSLEHCPIDLCDLLVRELAVERSRATWKDLLTVKHRHGHSSLGLILVGNKGPTAVCADLVLHVEELLHGTLLLALLLEGLLLDMVRDATQEDLAVRHVARPTNRRRARGC